MQDAVLITAFGLVAYEALVDRDIGRLGHGVLTIVLCLLRARGSVLIRSFSFALRWHSETAMEIHSSIDKRGAGKEDVDTRRPPQTM